VGGRTLTRTGAVVGTPGYMAPELVRGERVVTPAADVFSLGCVLFQCLTGRPVFEAEEPAALLAKILLQDAPRVRELAPQLPESLDDLVARMIAKEPTDRLPDMAAVRAALDASVGHRPARARSPVRTAGGADRQRAARRLRRAGRALGQRREALARPHAAHRREGADDQAADATSPGPRSMIEALETELASVHGARVHRCPTDRWC